MAPSKRNSGGGTPGQQRPISSFFSPGKSSTPASSKSQRSISSFFSPGPKNTPPSENKKKPVICIGHVNPSESASADNPSLAKDPSSLPLKRSRAEFEAKANKTLEDNPEHLIGKRLKVYWPMDDTWYEGVVKSYDNITGKHVVLYDDAEEESLCFEDEKIEWIDPDHKMTAPARQFRRLRKMINEDSKDGDGLSPEEKNSDEVIAEETPSSCKHKRATPQSVIKFDSENDESEMDDDSDEDWGNNGKNVDDNLGSGSEEIEELEKEEDITPKDRRSKRTPKQSASGKRKTAQKAKNQPSSSRRNTETHYSSIDKDKMLSTPCSFSKVNTIDVKAPRQDDDGALGKKPNASQDKAIRSEFPITVTGEIAERFGNRTEKFKFLFEGRKDASGRKPEDPDYDPRTVYLPQDFVKGLTGGQRQWWEFKSQHMDKVLFFKMGKFYELFEMDAHIGALELDLQYMKGEQPHCGFPEKNFTENVEKLARKGYRVLVVEQTETPDQLEQRRKETGTKDKVVKREICAVITKGTIIEGGMLVTCPDANYMMAITEGSTFSEINTRASCVIGVCVADASTSRFMLGQFSDDSTRSRLCSVLSEIRPVELIKPRGMLSNETERVLRDHTRKPLVNSLAHGTEFWDAKTSLFEIKKLYRLFHDKSKSREAKGDNEMESLPDVISQMVNVGENGQLALSAFGGCLSYLRQVFLDQSLLSFGKLEILPYSDFPSKKPESGESSQVCLSQDTCLVEPYVTLDAAALENLEILENNKDGSASGTLFTQVDHCITAFGKRLLRKWLVRPLRHTESILKRQDAIAEIKNIALDSAVNFQKELARLPDMERLLARLYSNSGTAGRNASKVILYEDAAKKQLQEFITALRGCQSMMQACTSFKDSTNKLNSSLLQHLLTPGRGLPDVKQIMEHFQTAFDWSEAEKTGRIIPFEGVDRDYDLANNEVREIKTSFAEHLDMQRTLFECDEINYVTVGKDQYQIEIPESMLAKVPREYEAHSSRKGYRRFLTPRVKELLQDLSDAQSQIEASLKGTLQGLVRQFCEHHSVWRDIVHVVAELDVLISLAFTSNYLDGPTCRPSVRDAKKLSCDENEAPFIYAKGLRHPILAGLAGSGSFVPNDVNIGGHRNSHFMLLTGPNMGGKSTLLRQVCLAIILAQLGADVPAEDFQLSPVDHIFVRMGARDHIMASQSTFLVELSETACMLSSATRNSFVALDELGRGTATSDGQAIAHAVLEHLSHKIKCCGMFSTHYHHLAADYQNDPTVGLYHMGCKVGTRVGGPEEVTFLYKLTPGACPKSYGVNVARLAGMPDTILERAAKISAEFESQYGQRDTQYTVRSLVDITVEEKHFEEVLNVIKKLKYFEVAEASKMNDLIGVWKKIAIC